MNAMQKLDDNDPRLIAWNEYKASESYRNSFNWAEHEKHRDGSMWSAFIAGFEANQAALLREQASAQQAIIEHCVVTEAVTPDMNDPHGTIARLIDYHVGLEREQAKGAQHPDDDAVDAFAETMKAKLAEARCKGRCGWQDKQDCSQIRLSNMLRNHVEKGDPRDVANFCMFLHQRGEAILPRSRLDDVELDAKRYRFIRDKQATIIYKRKGHGEWEPLVDTYESSTRCGSLDAAIDYAMLSAAPSDGGEQGERHE